MHRLLLGGALTAMIARRNLIGSDAAIVLTCTLHVFEASMFLGSTVANGSVGMASLLHFFQMPWLAAMALYAFAACAVAAEWGDGLSRKQRFLLLFPQFILLMITSVGALGCVLLQHYADGVPRGWEFIACDQAHRIGMPFWYGTAILARVKES